MYDKLMSYLGEKGMQPDALERLIQKMEQTRGTQPMFGPPKGMRGNMAALGRKPPTGARNANI